MFLSREIDKRLCQIYMKIHIYAISYENRSSSTNTQPIWKRRYSTGAWESQVCYYYSFFLKIGTRTSANGSAVSLSRNTDGNHVTIILRCHWLKLWWRNNTDYMKWYYQLYLLNFFEKYLKIIIGANFFSFHILQFKIDKVKGGTAPFPPLNTPSGLRPCTKA